MGESEKRGENVGKQTSPFSRERERRNRLAREAATVAGGGRRGGEIF